MMQILKECPLYQDLLKYKHIIYCIYSIYHNLDIYNIKIEIKNIK